MRIAGVIIAGGRSARMGSDKTLMTVAGRTLLTRTLERIGPQVMTVALNVNGTPAGLAGSQLTQIPDRRPEIGTPLAGLHAGLSWAREQGFDALASIPCDCPFLPRDLIGRLASAKAKAAIAASGGQTHFLTGLWSHTLLEKLEQAMETGHMFRVRDWAAHAGAVSVEWPVEAYDPFFNVNTPEQLAEANRIAAEFGL